MSSVANPQVLTSIETYGAAIKAADPGAYVLVDSPALPASLLYSPADFKSIGTDEVWCLSPEAATVEDLYLERGGLGRNTIFAEGVLRPKHLLNVPIDTPRIWPD